ncbi:GNAT family N-acetyltransferase [Clostridium culturomicium]|uniref:GNAT family N-acetyltransferase n=1 Tax=Clostridium culturomicium TaxID=1499683 RepID=UPI000AA6ADDB|nr:GNAT family protein [Clostridium culturomicium]
MNEIIRSTKLKNGSDLVLREVNINDAEAMLQYLNIVGGESDNLLFGANEFCLTVEQEKNYIESMRENDNALMAIGVIDGQIISIAQVAAPPRKRIAHNGELAISVKKEYWSMGVGTEMMKLLIDFAKSTSVIKNISLGVKSDNEKGIKLYEKMGFEKVGVHRNFFNIDGKYFHEILMDLYLE